MDFYVNTLLNDQQIRLQFTDKPVTPWGGMVLFSEYAHAMQLKRVLGSAMPFQVRSPNATNPVDIVVAFLVGVLLGARRFAHLERWRGDEALKRILGLKRLVSDTTVTRFFKRLGPKLTNLLFSALVAWQLRQMVRQQPIPEGGYTLDLDSSVLERYGHQEGARKGYNPRKPGRPSHHPLLAVLAPTSTIVHSWLRPGDTSSATGGGEFLDETLGILQANGIPVKDLRADSGFGNEPFLKKVESTYREYAIAARFTGGLQAKIAAIQTWRLLDTGLEIAETAFHALGWSRERRIIVIRQHKPEREQARGRQLRLFPDPEYVYQAIITNKTGLPEEIWRFYRGRSDMENRFKELKWDYGIDGFCMQKFYATEGAFRLICFLFNLVTLWQRALGYPSRHTLGTLRAQILACGAILGRSGKTIVLRLALKDRWQRRFLDQLARVQSTEIRHYGAVGFA